MRILRSNSTDAAVNAAVEDMLYSSWSGETLLLFYKNSPSVVIGRNQNPWREADVGWCRSNGIPVQRRISGGGAVYHDLGNLNYAFFTKREDYNPDRFVGIAAAALQSLGIEAEIQGQHSIWVQGRKISGSAFALNSRRALHHGCILANTDLAMLSRALRHDGSMEFSASAVASVPAPVTNISVLKPGITAEQLRQAIVEHAEKTLGEEGLAGECGSWEEIPEFAAKLEQFRSDAWNFERTPAFDMTLRRSGGVLLCHVNNGHVAEAKYMSKETTVPAMELLDMKPEYIIEKHKQQQLESIK